MNLTPSERGEGAVEIGGQTYRLAFDVHAMASAEDYVESVTGKSVGFDEIQAGALRGRVRHVIAIFYGMTRRHHSDITAQRAADLVQTSFEEGAQLARRVAASAVDAIPDPKDIDELRKGAPTRPRKAQSASAAGTGANSKSTRGSAV